MPAFELRKRFCSPVPIHTMFGLDGATVTSPKAVEAACSNTGCQVVASLSVFHTPPDAVAT